MLLPFCLCGCGRRVKRIRCRFYTLSCVPTSIRVEGARKGSKTYAYRRRAKAFRADMDRLGTSGTREDFAVILQQVYRRAYNSGYNVGYRAGIRKDSTALLHAKRREAA
jgi:hypothetical protein